jgi:hypothetical protein
MTSFIAQALQERQLGLALHYPLLHAMVIGLDARRTLEFGAGGSTRVITDAIALTRGMHVSISTEDLEAVEHRYGVHRQHWRHFCGLSDEHRNVEAGDLDLVLHDGSHAADVVARDVAWVWPKIRRFGLLLVHDTQHSYVGAEMREGLARGLELAGACRSMTTLPFGFGLTIVRREDGEAPIVPARAKIGSPHTTWPA